VQDVELNIGEKVILNVDVSRRKEIQRHHTATHIMHEALRKILGDHVKQCGSYVEDCGLRFDFNHFAALTRNEWIAVEDFVNAVILENLPVTAQEMPFKEVPAACIAHFNEKYGEVVRVLSIGNVSMELCGGCHVSATGELGIFKIVKESAIAAGVRRIEAVVGCAAKEYVDHHITLVNELEQQFSVRGNEIPVKIKQLQHTKNIMERRLRTVLEKNNRQIFGEICRYAVYENDLKKICGIFEIEKPNDLRSLGTLAIKKEACDVAILAGNLAESAVITINCSPKGVENHYNASRTAQQIAEKFGGRGGGNPTFGMVNLPKRLEFSGFEFSGLF
jgi:alanyl-tRNA synthetase